VTIDIYGICLRDANDSIILNTQVIIN
jgi:hypothetical protein